MKKISHKFIVLILVVLIISSLISILFHNRLLEPFYLYQKKQDINEISKEFIETLDYSSNYIDAIESIESINKVLIVQVETLQSDNIVVNQDIQARFQDKGIGFQKYWFWEEDYKRVLDGKQQIKFYKQDQLNYNLLINYMKYDDSIFAVTMIVPDVTDAFGIATIFLIGTNVITIVTAMGILIYLVKRITKPLEAFTKFAQDMSHHIYSPIKVDTKDELQVVADSLNQMGKQIIETQDALRLKNESMEALIEGIAHELKTPIALISLYLQGMKDGLNDDTFLDTLIQENKEMGFMVEDLIQLTNIRQTDYQLERLRIDLLLQNIINKYFLLFEEKSILLNSTIEDNLTIMGNKEIINNILSNLILNAIKYVDDEYISLTLLLEEGQVVFKICNHYTNDNLNIDRIFDPYYVGENSRNKLLSGTGLGLSIVKRICEDHNYGLNCTIKESNITFKVVFPDNISFIVVK